MSLGTFEEVRESSIFEKENRMQSQANQADVYIRNKKHVLNETVGTENEIILCTL